MNKFHRILLTSGLAATASLMANSAAFAGTTATVPLSGTIPSSLTITVTATGDNLTLPLTPGTTNTSSQLIKIATITGATTNSSGGLKVTLTTTGVLVSGANSIPLSSFAESSGAGATTYSTFRSLAPINVLNVTGSTTSGSASDSSIFIGGYTVPVGQAPGTYSGSVVFTATDN